jgi:hypothetical protein
MTVSMRSTLAAGLAAVTVSAAAVVPVTLPGSPAITLPSIELSASVLPWNQPAAAAAGAVIGDNAPRPAAAALPAFPGPVTVSATGSASDTIINAYNAIEPWVQWGFEVAAWAVSYLPWPLGWLGQQINIAYNTGEPIVQALVYSFAYLIDGQFDLIGPTLINGVNNAVTNLVTGEIAWVLSFFPPLPPISFPVLPGASVAARAAAVAAPAPARTRSAEATVAGTPGAETSVAAAPGADTTGADTTGADTTGADATGVDTIAEQDTIQPPATEAPRGRRGVNRSAIRAQPPAAVQDSPSGVAAPVTAAEITAAGVNGPATAAETPDAPIVSTAKEPRRAARVAASRSAHPAE